MVMPQARSEASRCACGMRNNEWNAVVPSQRPRTVLLVVVLYWSKAIFPILNWFHACLIQTGWKPSLEFVFLIFPWKLMRENQLVSRSLACNTPLLVSNLIMNLLERYHESTGMNLLFWWRFGLASTASTHSTFPILNWFHACLIQTGWKPSLEFVSCIFDVILCIHFQL